MKVNYNEFLKHLKGASKATSNEAMHPVLKCIHIYNDNDTLYIEAANSYMLYRGTTKILNSTDVEFNIKVNGDFIKSLPKTTKSMGEVTCILGADNKQFSVDVLNSTLNFELQSGIFPNLNNLINRSKNYQVAIDKKLLVRALENHDTVIFEIDTSNSVQPINLVSEDGSTLSLVLPKSLRKGSR